MIIGFTGTGKGMTTKQLQTFQNQLFILQPKEFHHGDCVGADYDAHLIALAMKIPIVIHPPENSKFLLIVMITEHELK